MPLCNVCDTGKKVDDYNYDRDMCKDCVKKNAGIKVCKNTGCLNRAVMDLIFGIDAEMERVPWCSDCVAPHTWDLHPYHHAESYSHGETKYVKVENKEPQCTKCGEPANITAFEYMYCTPCYNAKVGEKDKVADTFGEVLEAAQKVIGGIREVIRENFVPKMPSSAGVIDTKHLEKATKEAWAAAFKEPIKEQLECEAAKQAELKKEIDEPLYNRQPHYEGGIDPITFGQDNLTPEEMNGFYKMNVIKYVARCDRKNGLEDLEKARDYLNLLIESYEESDPEVEELQRLKAAGKTSGRKSPLIREHWHTEEDVTEVWRPREDKPFAVEKNGEFFMEKCERLKNERVAKDYIATLNKNDEVYINRNISREVLSLVLDYTAKHYNGYQYTEDSDGVHIEV